MFGTERLRQALSEADGDLLGTTLEIHGRFVGAEWEQEDDITMVTVVRQQVAAIGRPPSGRELAG
jgi:hypothetical protein